MHVIFPDKQSILRERFIVPNPICLGEQHLAASPDVAEHVFYPLALLRAEQAPVFLKTDTHMTDRGTILAVARLVEILTGEPQSARQDMLLARLTEQRQHTGDLGMKLDPPPSHIEQFALPYWPIKWFHNNLLGGNNGIVDLYFSSDATYSNRLLWFGDSFGREAARFLSFFFREVVFLRTPFFHPEIFDQIHPDILITQNVERYLDSCVPDSNRPPFFMYPYLAGLCYQPPPNFIEAFAAVLSFPRQPYQTFIQTVLQPSVELTDGPHA